jgi:hypothetical protein
MATKQYRWQAYCHARRLYIETGDVDAYANMLEYVDLEGDYWKIMGDDPNICNPAWNIDIIYDTRDDISDT